MGAKSSNSRGNLPKAAGEKGSLRAEEVRTADETGLISPLGVRNALYRPLITDLTSQEIEPETEAHKEETDSEDEAKATEWGLTGLQNLGNTCYMNSILQCIAHCPRLNNSLCETAAIDAPSRSRLAGAAGKVLRQMRTSADFSVVSPIEVKAAIGKRVPAFGGSGQQDAQEFLRHLLDGLSQDFNRSRSKAPYKELPTGSNYTQIAAEWFAYSQKLENSIITDYFRGQMLTLISSCKGRCKTVACDTFLDLSVPVPVRNSPVSLENCLSAFTESTSVSEYYCEKCRKTGISQVQMTLWRLPPLLVIHLKRFGRSGRNKVETVVKYPVQQLDLKRFGPYSQHESLRDVRYRLVAVSHHVGGLTGGHYYA